MVHDVWVEVDLAALKHNFAQVKSAVDSRVKVMAVIKGNGFGHGYVEPARAFVEAGADMLAVTRLDEALLIREAGIDSPILLFAPIQPANAEAAVEAELDMTVASLPLSQAISAAAHKLGKTARIWIKVDSGMGRLGLFPDETRRFFDDIHGLPGLAVAGIYTHFASSADADLTASRRQLQIFASLLNDLKNAGIDYGTASAANSSAILRMPDAHFDMVRSGTLLYGQYPSANVPHTLDLKSTWTLKARIAEIRSLPKETAVGYGGEYITRRQTKAAIIPIGYADGFALAPEGPTYRQSIIKFAVKKMRWAPSVRIGGTKAPVLGRVAMQMIVVDITDIPNVNVGDEAVVPALRIPTSPLIPRVYVDSLL